MRLTLVIILGLLAAGCATNYTPDVKYFDLSPSVVGAAVYWKSTDPVGFGLTHKGCDRYSITRDGTVSLLKSDSCSAPGPAQQLVGTAEGAGATTAVAGAIIPLVIPGSTTTVNTAVKK